MYELKIEFDSDIMEDEDLQELVENLNCEMELIDEDNEIYLFTSKSFAVLQEIGEQLLQDDPTNLIDWQGSL